MKATTYHIKPMVIAAMAIVSLLFFGSVAMQIAFPSFMTGDLLAKRMFTAVFGVAASGLALLALHLATWRLQVGEDTIEMHSLFSTRTLRYHQVVSLMERRVRRKSNTQHVADLEGNGKHIVITDNMAGYAEALDIIRSRVGPEAIQRGVELLPAYEARQTRIAFAILAALSLFGMGGLGLFLRQDALNTIAVYDNLDRRGVATIGHVSGWFSYDRKSLRYYVVFEFEANGSVHKGSSPISASKYEKLRNGQQIEVLYLPNSPAVCRTKQSIGPDQAKSKLTTSLILLGLAATTPLLLLQLSKRSVRCAAKIH